MKNRRLLIGFLALTIGVLTTAGSFRHILDRTDSKGMADGVEMASSYLTQMKSNQVTGQINPADVLRARAMAEEMKSNRSLGLDWTSMGPDNYAGRTRALIIDNRDNTGKTIFAGSVSGGIWKSTTGGLTWTKIDAGNGTLNVSCMTQAPNGDIYVGTGENFSSGKLNMFSGFMGQGIYKSTDGITFTKLSSTAMASGFNPQDNWAFVNKIAAGNNNIVVAATNAGLRFSTDGGQSWGFAKSDGQNLNGTSTEVKIGPDGTIAASVDNHLYISNGADDGFVMRSTGDGENILPKDGIARIQVAFAASDASTIYAMLVADGTAPGYFRGQLRGVYVTKDKGASWRVVGPGASGIFNVFGNSSTALNYGEYAGTIVVSPTNPDKVFIGGMVVWEGTKIQETGYYQWQQRVGVMQVAELLHCLVINPNDVKNIYFSSDLGVGITKDNFETVQSLNRGYKTSMFYTVAFDDQGRVFGGTQGNGVVYLNRKGNTIENATPLNFSFVGGSVDASLVNPAALFYSSTGGVLTRSPDYGASEAVSFLYSDGAITNTNTANFITPFKLWENFNNQNSRDSVWFKSTKNHNAGDVVIAHSKNASFPFKYTLTSDMGIGDSVQVKDVVTSAMFVGTTNAVYLTRRILDFSKLPEWFKISEFTGVPSCLAYSSDANFVYVGTTTGQLIRIANIALAYDFNRADVSSSGCVINTMVVKEFAGRYITSVAVDPHNDNHVLVTLGNYGNSEYVFRSTNALNQYPVFESIQGNLPAMPVYSAIIEMSNANRVILGTEMGVYSTDLLTASPVWSTDNFGIDPLPVMMVRQQTVSRPWIEGFTGVNNYGAIYIATHGNGIYENRKYVGIDKPQDINTTVAKSLMVYPNPVRDEVNFTLLAAENEKVKVDIYSLNGSLVKTLNMSLPVGEQAVSVSAGDLVNGTYILQVTAGAKTQVAKFVVTR